MALQPSRTDGSIKVLLEKLQRRIGGKTNAGCARARAERSKNDSESAIERSIPIVSAALQAFLRGLFAARADRHRAARKTAVSTLRSIIWSSYVGHHKARLVVSLVLRAL